jgi:hypothetical protein
LQTILGMVRNTNSKGSNWNACVVCVSFNIHTTTYRNHNDKSGVSSDTNQRLRTAVAFDALKFKFSNTQFTEPNIVRELNKAYAAFFCERDEGNVRTMATSSWGCGNDYLLVCCCCFAFLMFLFCFSRSVWWKCSFEISYSMDGSQYGATTTVVFIL